MHFEKRVFSLERFLNFKRKTTSRRIHYFITRLYMMYDRPEIPIYMALYRELSTEYEVKAKIQLNQQL